MGNYNWKKSKRCKWLSVVLKIFLNSNFVSTDLSKSAKFMDWKISKGNICKGTYLQEYSPEGSSCWKIQGSDKVVPIVKVPKTESLSVLKTIKDPI